MLSLRIHSHCCLFSFLNPLLTYLFTKSTLLPKCQPDCQALRNKKKVEFTIILTTAAQTTINSILHIVLRPAMFTVREGQTKYLHLGPHLLEQQRRVQSAGPRHTLRLSACFMSVSPKVPRSQLSLACCRPLWNEDNSFLYPLIRNMSINGPDKIVWVLIWKEQPFLLWTRKTVI